MDKRMPKETVMYGSKVATALVMGKLRCQRKTLVGSHEVNELVPSAVAQHDMFFS